MTWHDDVLEVGLIQLNQALLGGKVQNLKENECRQLQHWKLLQLNMESTYIPHIFKGEVLLSHLSNITWNINI